MLRYCTRACRQICNYYTIVFSFRKFFLAASLVEQPERKFNIDEYSDVVMLTKPVIYISIKEICDTHKLLLDHRNTIAPDGNDPLQELLDDVGEHADVKELLGMF